MAAAAGKTELVRRLSTNGLAPEACESYFYALKQFLTSRTTKIEFEDALSQILTPDKIPIHNNLIKDILRGSFAKKEDLPAIITPRKERTPQPPKKTQVVKRPPPSGPVPKQKDAQVADVVDEDSHPEKPDEAAEKNKITKGPKPKGPKVQKPVPPPKLAGTGPGTTPNRSPGPRGPRERMKTGVPSPKTAPAATVPDVAAPPVRQQGPAGAPGLATGAPTNRPRPPEAPANAQQAQQPDGPRTGPPKKPPSQGPLKPKANATKNLQRQTPAPTADLAGSMGLPGTQQANQLPQNKPVVAGPRVGPWVQSTPPDAKAGTDRPQQVAVQKPVKRPRPDGPQGKPNKVIRAGDPMPNESYTLTKEENEKKRIELAQKTKELDNPTSTARPVMTSAPPEVKAPAASAAGPQAPMGPMRTPIQLQPNKTGPVLMGRSGAEGPTYQNVPLYPLRPGLKVDMEAFLKMRNKVRRIVAEELGTTTVSDDAVALLTQALELHMKNILEASSGKSAGRNGEYRTDNGRKGLLLASGDIREGLAQNPGKMLGEDHAVDLERLILTLH